ncbi:MAG: hypothetical protein M1817_001278 [Caeruleum heppii]|nr:MAG: hypothetical protein M1817_001278 [Caeruleum heppii]
MCVTEVFTDVYPNSNRRQHQRLLHCDDFNNGIHCNPYLIEHEPRLLPYPEAPAAVARTDQDQVVTVVHPERKKSVKKSRRYWKKGDQLIVDIPLGRKKSQKKKDKEDDIIAILEPVQDRHSSIPIPPPAPMAPRQGARRPTQPHSPPMDSFPFSQGAAFEPVPPPPYHDRRPRRREPPVIVQVSPPSSPRLSPVPLTPTRETVRPPSPPSPRTPRPTSSGDRILRQQVENRREIRRAEQERREAHNARRLATIAREDAEMALAAQRRRDEDRRARIQDRTSGHDYPAVVDATGRALRDGRRVVRFVDPVSVHQEEHGHGHRRRSHHQHEDSSDGDSWTSAPGVGVRIHERHSGRGSRDEGPRVTHVRRSSEKKGHERTGKSSGGFEKGGKWI